MSWRPSPRTFVVLAGYLLGGLCLYRGLPETGWPAAAMVAFLLPTAVAITDVLLRGLCVRHPVDESNAANVLAIYDAIMLRVAIFVMSVHGAVLLAVLGLLSGRRWAAPLVPTLLGVTMIGIGNLLPRTRPNLAIGIRTRRTLSDRALWMRVHRRAGYMLVACGAIIVLSAMTVPRPFGPAIVLVVAPAALVGTWVVVRSSSKPLHA
jgi:uncharacterized membrane protein